MNEDVRVAKVASTLVILGIYEYGGTVDPQGRSADLTSGYSVGGAVESLVVQVPKHGFDVLKLLVQVEDWYREATKVRPLEFTGVWSDAGFMFFDGVNIIQDRDEALRIGNERGQVAIWDFAEVEEVNVYDAIKAAGAVE